MSLPNVLKFKSKVDFTEAQALEPTQYNPFTHMLTSALLLASNHLSHLSIALSFEGYHDASVFRIRTFASTAREKTFFSFTKDRSSSVFYLKT